MRMSFSLVQLVLIGGVLAAAVLLGLIVQRVFTARLHALARKTVNAWDDILVESLHGVLVLWFVLVGLAVILKLIPLRPDVLKIVQRAIGVVGIVSAVIFASRLARKAIHVYVDRNVEVPTSIFKNFASAAISLVGLLIILDYLGVPVTSLLTALGVGGLAVALALQDTMSNLFAGLNILMTHKIRPGDYVRLDSGEEGVVVDITWRNTTIQAPEDNLIVVPNVKLGGVIVTNTHLPEEEMGLFVPVTVAFDNDLDKVERVTLEVAREAMTGPGLAVPGFEPKVRMGAFTELGVRLTVVLRLKEYRDQYPLKHDLLKRLHARYKEEGIKLAVLPPGALPRPPER
jgi:small-conductance mechanosensitive channel